MLVVMLNMETLMLVVMLDVETLMLVHETSILDPIAKMLDLDTCPRNHDACSGDLEAWFILDPVSKMPDLETVMLETEALMLV